VGWQKIISRHLISFAMVQTMPMHLFVKLLSLKIHWEQAKMFSGELMAEYVRL
jgi:hypothetical protein